MLICKILGHNIDDMAAFETGEIECTRCNEATNIGAVDYIWLNQGFLTGIKNKVESIKLWIKLRAYNMFNEPSDLPF